MRGTADRLSDQRVRVGRLPGDVRGRRGQHADLQRALDAPAALGLSDVKTLNGVADDWPITYEDLAPYYDRMDAAVGLAGVEGDPMYPDGHGASAAATPDRQDRADRGPRNEQAGLALVAVPQRHCLPTSMVSSRDAPGGAPARPVVRRGRSHPSTSPTGRPPSGTVPGSITGARVSHDHRRRQGPRGRCRLRRRRRTRTPAEGPVGRRGRQWHRHPPVAAALRARRRPERSGELVRSGRQAADAAPQRRGHRHLRRAARQLAGAGRAVHSLPRILRDRPLPRLRRRREMAGHAHRWPVARSVAARSAPVRRKVGPGRARSHGRNAGPRPAVGHQLPGHAGGDQPRRPRPDAHRLERNPGTARPLPAVGEHQEAPAVQPRPRRRGARGRRSGHDGGAPTCGRSSPGTCWAPPRWAPIPRTSVVNEWNIAHDVPNLAIVDGSVMPTSGAVNPTATITATGAARRRTPDEQRTLAGDSAE